MKCPTSHEVVFIKQSVWGFLEDVKDVRGGR